LPIPFYVWVDAWLPRRHSTQGALVALIGFVEQTGGSSAHAEDYLRAVASRAQMDFLLRDRKLAAQAENMAYAEELSQRAKAMTPVLGQILSQRVDPYRHWGINE